MSIRDYLYRVRRIQQKVGASIVLAETAQQLYRDTTYKDLISFEEDIARLSSIILIISESPGSLAELGSFSSEVHMRDALRIIISENHSTAESFMRYGPIKRVENIDRRRIGIFPWRIHHSNGLVIKSSVQPHYNEILKFIIEHISAIPDSFSYKLIPDRAIFYDIIWILSLLDAVPPEPLYEAIRLLHPAMADAELRNILYALRVCQWINVFSYSGREYYYLPINRDPYEYSFLPGRRVRDISATKIEIVSEFRAGAVISKAITTRLLDKRRGL